MICKKKFLMVLKEDYALVYCAGRMLGPHKGTLHPPPLPVTWEAEQKLSLRGQQHHRFFLLPIPTTLHKAFFKKNKNARYEIQPRFFRTFKYRVHFIEVFQIGIKFLVMCCMFIMSWILFRDAIRIRCTIYFHRVCVERMKNPPRAMSQWGIPLEERSLSLSRQPLFATL